MAAWPRVGYVGIVKGGVAIDDDGVLGTEQWEQHGGFVHGLERGVCEREGESGLRRECARERCVSN